MLPNCLLMLVVISRVRLGLVILLYPISLAIGIKAVDLEILAVLADRSLPATFCLALPTGLTRMVDSMSASRAWRAWGIFGRLLQPRYGDFCGLDRLPFPRGGARGAWDTELGRHIWQ